ncbi:MAG: hypothetical protein AMXMBFR84_20920 [Candidatus Hydrogenedentota bacterium]
MPNPNRTASAASTAIRVSPSNRPSGDTVLSKRNGFKTKAQQTRITPAAVVDMLVLFRSGL